jgi:hypothetical protein
MSCSTWSIASKLPRDDRPDPHRPSAQVLEDFVYCKDRKGLATALKQHVVIVLSVATWLDTNIKPEHLTAGVKGSLQPSLKVKARQ